MLDDHVPALHHMLTSAMAQGDSLKEFANIPTAVPIFSVGGGGFIDSTDKAENSEPVKSPLKPDRHSMVMEDVSTQTLHVEKSMLQVLREQGDNLEFLAKQLSTATQQRLNTHLAKKLKEMLELLGVAPATPPTDLGGLFGRIPGGAGPGKTAPPKTGGKKPGIVGKAIGAAAAAAAGIGALFGLKDAAKTTVPEALKTEKPDAKIPTGTAVSPSAINDLATPDGKDIPKTTGAPAESVAKAPAKGAKAKDILNKMSWGKVGAVGTALTAVPMAVEAYDVVKSDAAKSEKGEVLGGMGGSVVGGIGGGFAGAKAGALAGAGIGALFGGIGAVPGAMIGGLVGSIGGSILGASIGEEVGSKAGSAIGTSLESREAVANAVSPASTGFANSDSGTAAAVPVVAAAAVSTSPKAPVPQGHTDAERVIESVKEKSKAAKAVTAPANVPVETVVNNNKETVLKDTNSVFNKVAYATAPAAVIPSSTVTETSNVSGDTQNDNRSWYKKVQSWFTGNGEQTKPFDQAKPIDIPEIDTKINQPGLKPGVDGPRGLTAKDQRSASNPNFIYALGERESGNNYSANNGSYYGAYQLGDAALKDLGYKDKKNKWVGKDGINSLTDFMANPDVQDRAVNDLMAKNWAYINSSPIKEDADGKPVYAKDMIGQKINGVTITDSGLLAASHLGGHASVTKMLKSDGAVMPIAGNKVPIINYMQAMGGKDVAMATSQPSLVTGDIGTYKPADNVSYVVAGKNKAVDFTTNVPIGRERLRYHESQYMADAQNVINRVAEVRSPPVTNVSNSSSTSYNSTSSNVSNTGDRPQQTSRSEQLPQNVSQRSTTPSMYSQDILGIGTEGARAQDVRAAYLTDYKKPESINVSRYEVEPQASSTDIAKLESVFRESIIHKEKENTTIIASNSNGVAPLTFENVPTALDTDLGAQLINGVL